MLKRYLRRAAGILGAPALPRRARLDLLKVAAARRLLLGPEEFQIDLVQGGAFLSKRDILFDYTAFFEIFVEECYKTDYRGNTVIDGGAHKGYYGAYALLKGAKAVLSFEPESRNYDLLCRCAETFRAKGHSWSVYNEAIGSEDGELTLHVSDRSWSHSLYRRSDVTLVEEQKVAVRSFSSVLEQIRESSLGAPVVVKLDIEGAECGVVLGTPVQLWHEVDELFVEFVSIGPCEWGDLLDHLGTAGFFLIGEAHGGVYHLVRRQSDDL